MMKVYGSNWQPESHLPPFDGLWRALHADYQLFTC